MKKEVSIVDYGKAYWDLGVYEKYLEEYKKNSNSFKIKAVINSEVLEIPLNSGIHRYIYQYLNKKINECKKIMDENPQHLKHFTK
jgi:hypothetical protein